MSKANGRVLAMTAAIVLIALMSVFVFVACDTDKTGEPAVVTLDFNGGTFGGETSVTVQTAVGETLDLSAYLPTMDGYDFVGWTDGKNSVGTSYVVTGDATLYPQWSQLSSVSASNLLNAVFSAIDGGDAFNFTFAGEGSDADGTTSFSLSANLRDQGDHEFAFELQGEDELRAVGLYIVDGVFYVYTPSLGGIALSDIDMSWLLTAAATIPDLAGNFLIDGNISGIPVKTILDLAFNMFAKASLTTTADGTVYVLNFNPTGLRSINSILNMINLDALVAGAGLNLKISSLVNWLIGVLPDIDITIRMTVDTQGKIAAVSASGVSADESVFSFATSEASIGEPRSIVPDEVGGYLPFSLGDISVSADLEVQNDGADLGALINALAGSDAVPSGLITLDSDLRYNISIKTALDIAASGGEDKNLIAIDIGAYDGDGALRPLWGIYYKQGAFYLDPSYIVGPIYGGKWRKAEVALDELIAGVKSTVRNAIDGAFGTSGLKVTDGTPFAASVGTLALSSGEDGWYISDGLHNFLQALFAMFGVSGDSVRLTHGNDAEKGDFSRLTLAIDNAFIAALANSFGSAISVPDFGEIDLDVTVFGDGAQIDLGADLHGARAALRFTDFSIGTRPSADGYQDIADYIDERVGDASRYTYSMKELLASVLCGVSADISVDATLAAGDYDLSALLGMLGLEAQNSLPVSITQQITLDATLSADISLSPTDNALVASVELLLDSPLEVGGKTVAQAGKLIGVYSDGDELWLDLSGLELWGAPMPSAKANFDLSAAIASMYDAVDVELKADVSSVFGTGAQTLSQRELLMTINADGSDSPLTTDSELSAAGAAIVLDSQGLKARVTLDAIAAMLGAFGIDLALPDTLQLTIGAQLGSDGLSLDASAAIGAAHRGYDDFVLELAISAAADDVATGIDGHGAAVLAHIAEETAELVDARSDLLELALDFAGQMSLSAQLSLESGDNADVGAYLEGLLADVLPQGTQIEIALDDVQLGLEVKLDKASDRYAVLLYSGQGETRKAIVSAYAFGENVLISVLGAGDFALRDTGIPTMIAQAVDDAAAKVDGADLNDILASLTTGGDATDGESGETVPDEPSAPSEPVQSTTDVLLGLLGGLSVSDLSVALAADSGLLAQIFAALGVEIDFLSANAQIDLADGEIGLSAVVGDGDLTLSAAVKAQGTDVEALDFGFAHSLVTAYEGSAADDADALRDYLVGKLQGMSGWHEGDDLSLLAQVYTDALDAGDLVYFSDADDVRAYLLGLLDGLSAKAKLDIEFNAGTYDLLQLIGKFTDLGAVGLPSDAAIALTFDEPSLAFEIDLQAAVRGGADESVISFALTAARDIGFGTASGGEAIFAAGDTLLGLYLYQGSLYIDASGLRLLGLTLPVFRADGFDAGKLLYDALDNALSGLLGTQDAQTSGGQSSSALALAGEDAISLVWSQGRLQAQVTMGVISALVGGLLQGDSAATVTDILGALDGLTVGIEAGKTDGGFGIGVSAEGELLSAADGSPSDAKISLTADTADATIGDDGLHARLSAQIAERVDGFGQTYSDLLQGIANSLFTGSLDVVINADLQAKEYILTETINTILSAAAQDARLSVPISISAEDFDKQLRLRLQWQMDPNTAALSLMAEVMSGRDILIGIYLYKGALLVDLTGVGLVRIQLREVALIDEMTAALSEALGSLQGLDLGELLGGLVGNDGGSAKALALADGDDGAQITWIGQLLGALAVQNGNVRIAVSVALLESVIDAATGGAIDLEDDLLDLSADLGIFDGTLSFEGSLFGNMITIDVDTALQQQTIVGSAYIPAKFVLPSYEIDATSMDSVFRALLDDIADIDMTAKLAVSFAAGEYDLAQLLSGFGLTQLAGTELKWTFGEDTKIALDLNVKVKTNYDDAQGQSDADSMLAIELRTDGALRVGGDTLYADGTVLIGLYAYQGQVYADLSGISLFGLSLPVFRIDFDLMGALIDKVRALRPAQEDAQNSAVAVLTDAAGSETLLARTGGDGVEIGITRDGVAVTAALSAIMQLLGDFGVNVDLGAVTLPELIAQVSVADGISVSVGGDLLPQTDGSASQFELSASVASDDVIFGQDLDALAAKLGAKAQAYASYNDGVIATLREMLGKKTLTMDIAFGADAGGVDVMSLVSGLISGTGLDLNFPLTLNFDDLDFDFVLNVGWNLDERELMAELKLVGSALDKTLIGLYMDGSDLYISLAGVGLVDLKVAGSDLNDMLFERIEGLLDGIDEIHLSQVIADFFAEDGAETLQTRQTPSAGADDTQALAQTDDLLRYIVSAISIEDSSVLIELTDEITSALFAALGANTDFVIEASAGGSIAQNGLQASLNIDDKAQFDLALTIGDVESSFVPENAGSYTALDLNATPSDGRTVGQQAVVDFLDGFDFEFALDLQSSTIGTMVDSSIGTEYTRIAIKKVSGTTKLDNHQATAGRADGSGVLISMYDVDEREYNSHGTGTRSAILHVYIDYAARSATLYLCPGWLTIATSVFGISVDIASYLSSATFALDLLTPLGQVADNLIAAVAGEEQAPSEPSDPGTGSEPVQQPSRLDTALAELDINELLRPGVRLNIYGNGTTNINVGLDPYTINKLIDDLMSSIFGFDTIIDLTTMEMNGSRMFSANYLQYMWWDRIAASNVSSAASGGTAYSTWDSIIKQLNGLVRDVMGAAGYGNLSWLLGVIDWQTTTGNFHAILKRITSIAVFNTAELNVNLIEGTLTNISFVGKDTGAAVTRYAEDGQGEWYDTGEKLTQTVRSREGISSSTDRDGAYYYTYAYGGDGPSHNYGGRGIFYRSGYAYYASVGVDASNGYNGFAVATGKNYTNEVWIYNKSSAVGDPDHSPSGTSGVVDWGGLATKVSFDPYLYDGAAKNAAASDFWDRYFTGRGYAVYQSGSHVERATVSLSYNGSAFTQSTLRTLLDREGVHTIVASATFPSGTRSHNITLDVHRVSGTGTYAIRSVEPVSLHIYESVPSSVTVITYGGPRTYRIDGSSVRLVGDYSAPSVGGGTVQATLQFANGSSYPVTIEYLDSEIDDQRITLDWYGLNFADAQTARQELISMFTMLYGDGTFIPSEVTDAASWDTAALDALIGRPTTDLSAATIDVTVTFDKRIDESGAAEAVEPELVQTVKLTIEIGAKDKTSLLLDGQSESDVLRVQPYAYYKYLLSGNAADDPVPTAGTATYSDGTSERLSLAPTMQGVDFGYKGGTFAQAYIAALDGAEYDGGAYFDERTALDVIVERNVISAICFDDAHTRDWLAQDEKPLQAWVEFANGYATELPVFVADVGGGKAMVYIGIDVQMRDEHGRLAAFDSQYNFLQAFGVQVK